jgi:hypothetical protein
MTSPARIKVMSDDEIALLERRTAAATGFRRVWLDLQLSRQHARRATRTRLARVSGESTDRPVLRVDVHGFVGRSGGRMSTLAPPQEYRATTDQVAGLFPWIVGASAPILGTPLGEHLSTGAAVCFDPLSAWRAKAMTAPSCFIVALNGFGKSTLLRRLALGDIAAGTRVIWPGDVKPDGRRLTEQVEGGQIIEVGYGVGSINPLDLGPIGAAIEQLSDPQLRRATEFALWQRQLNIVAALMEIVRRAPLKDFEETLLASAIRLLYTPRRDGGAGFDRKNPAIISDLIDLIVKGPEELRQDVVADSDLEYREQTKPLLRTLRALIKGRFGEVFNGRNTVRLNVSAPSICLDMSSVPPGDELMRGAVLLAGWSEAFATIEAAHVLADAGLGPNLAFHVLMDELWQVLACGPMMVGRIDAVQRLQRTIGTAITAVTHSVAEMKAAGALGFVERSRARIIGPVPHAEIERLSEVISFSEKEKEMITSWSDTADLNTVIDQKQARGGASPIAAGTGHFLLKLGEGRRPGTPFRVVVPEAEREAGIHETDARLTAADRDRTAASA